MSWKSWMTVRQAQGDTFLWRRRAAPAIDFSYGDRRLAGVRAAARHRGAAGWPAIREQLAAAEDGEDLTFLVEGVQGVSGVERWIEEVLHAAPGDAHALLVSGARHVGWAWHARGRFAAGAAPESQRTLFRERLETAQRRLFAAAEREPAWAAPWYFLQLAGQGLELGPQVAQERFAAACRRSPGHAAAHRQHLRQLAAQGDGAHERTHAFARAAMLDAPEGSRLGELVALAHLEEWRDRGGDPDSAWLGRPQVIEALREAAAHSVLHPAFGRRLDWPLALNAFAMAFALAGDHRSAAPLFRALGNRPTETPWIYLDARSPLAAFRTWRARVTG
ncbi:hypothetical protein V2S66_08210 [Streptomyces sp. V4-01]|uniref:DUF4034 domain-containing protein n=1 Tax=Actinacidiphila polyblastidii TaxID=3110430 RepID=A0ABU7P809_9ACTN|nr:hypothetical protein [Streptomyces sp. V4-01]